MRRSISIAVTAIVAVALALSTSWVAIADSVPMPGYSDGDPNIVGNLDSLVFSPGEGVVATGWVFDRRDPQAVQANWQMQVQYPDGHAWWNGWATASLPRPDVAAAYPEAGPNHGFRLVVGFFDAGLYKMCPEIHFTTIGCAFVTIPPQTRTGTVESVAIDNASSFPGLNVRGWMSDSWGADYSGVSIEHTLTFTDLRGTTTTTIWPGDAYLSRPDIQQSHPGTAGIVGFNDHIDSRGSGTYKVCTKTGNEVTPAADFGCTSATFTALEGTPGEFTGAAELGSTLVANPGSWTPTPSHERTVWTRSVLDGQGPAVDVSSESAGNQHVVSAGDVGHELHLDDFVWSDGILGRELQSYFPTITIPGVMTSRLDGSDRYAAAVTDSQAQFPDSDAGAPVVYIASGENFPDALSAGPAAAKQGAPLLLTIPATLPDNVRAEIVRLHPGKIVVVGGPVSVSPSVLESLNTLAPTQRITGSDRFAVSRALIDYAFPEGAPSLYLTTGNSFADALSAGAAAGSLGEPVLLVDGHASATDAATLAELKALGTTAITIAGGPASVSAGVAASLGVGITVTRASGPDRFSAAVAINRAAFTSADSVYLTTGMNFPDGLSGSAHAGADHAPVYLSDGTCVPRDVITDIAALHATKVFVLGGTTTMQVQLTDLYACSY